MKVGIEKPMAMAALLAAAAFTAHAEVWYVPGWNRTAERDGLAYTSCTNVFKGNVCRFWQWDGDHGWSTSVANADAAAKRLADEIAATDAKFRAELTLVGHSLGGRIIARTLADLSRRGAGEAERGQAHSGGLKIAQGIMLAPAIPMECNDIKEMGRASERPAILVVNPKDVVLKYCYATVGGEDGPALGANGSPNALTNVVEYSVPKTITTETKIDAIWGKVEVVKSVCNHLAVFYFKELSRILDGKPSENAQVRVPQGRLNLEWKVIDAEVWWDVIDSCEGWKLERNVVTRHFRIVSPERRRAAWGSEEQMRRSFKKIRAQLAFLPSYAVDSACGKQLEAGFASPPDSARPHVYYMIMNGNMSKKCITADLEAMAKTGIGGVLVLDVGCFIPAGPVVFASPEWYDIMLHLHREAKRLGMEVTLPNCAGWSSSGGPWLTAEHAMKKTVCTETSVKGPRRFSGVLPRTKQDYGFYEDIAILAYPTPAKGVALTGLKAKIGLERKSFKRDTAAGRGRPALPAMIAKDKIVDLTAKMSKDGKLEWDAPAGDWTILRIGYACNGRRNHPASNGGCGFEVDKLSAEAMDIHFEALIGRLCRHLGVSAATDNSTGFNDAHIDSYEVDCQNWTQGLDRTFESRMGYSIMPYLPVFAGRIVESIDETERFLEDFRRLLADMFAENYAGRFTELCHKYGLKSSIEPYGNSNADNLQYGQSVDVPMTEFWSSVKYGDHHVGSIGNTIAASLAHVWGRRYVGAEAFTAAPQNGGRWLTTPFSIKAQGDRVFAAGVNRIVYHRYACQPWSDNRYLPGMTMGCWGIHLERTQTWWPLASDWFRYQSRCQWMLQEGIFAADLLCWCGESAPNGSQQNFKIPKGYRHDLCATKVVELLKVRNGKIVAPGGVEYEALVLPNDDTMSEKMVKRIGELLDAGAKVIAQRRPVRAPGCMWRTASVQQQEGGAGRPRPADAAHGRAVAPRPPPDGTGCRPYQTLVDSVWAKGVMECGVAEALKRLGVQPDFITDAEDVTWIHRKSESLFSADTGRAACPQAAADEVDWYFVAQDNEIDSRFEASFRVSGRKPEIWDAVTGEIRPANVWREENGRTIVALDFPPSGSAFVVFRNRGIGKHIVRADVSEAKPVKDVGQPAKKHKLVIKKAEYGLSPGMEVPVEGLSNKHRIDVTKLLAGHVKNGESINLDVGYSLFKRDPAFSFHKMTRIEYEYDGVAHVAERGEGMRFRVPDNLSILPPEWEWRGGELLAWKPITAKLHCSDGSVRTVSANPPDAMEVTGEWDVSFPPGWDAPESVVFPELESWSESRENGIKYFSGTATYRKSLIVGKFDSLIVGDRRIVLDLGDVKNFAEVKVNGKEFPVLWKPPFRVDITDAVVCSLQGGTASVQQQGVAACHIDLEIKVTNLWPNRLIGDDTLYRPDCEWVGHPRRGMVEYSIKEIPEWVKNGKPSPTGRHTFTTWRHWTKKDKLLPSGLIGPVVIRFGEIAE